MGQGKKKRGKQRKAAKSLAAASGVGNISKTVALIRKGDNKTTTLLDGSLEESNGILYEQSGILSTVLKFLQRCEEETFDNSMSDIYWWQPKKSNHMDTDYWECCYK